NATRSAKCRRSAGATVAKNAGGHAFYEVVARAAFSPVEIVGAALFAPTPAPQESPGSAPVPSEKPLVDMSSALLASVTVDLDKSVFVQMALFGVLILILDPLLFRPLLRLFALREERTDGAR